MIVVGSTALEANGITLRKPSDVDVWVSEGEPVPEGRFDVSVLPEAVMALVEHEQGYATIDSVYTIKCSHLGWDIFWQKHKSDILILKMQHDAQLIEPLYKALVEHWKQVHGNKDFLSLYKDKTEFFNDHVTYVYDHDYLHELVALPNKPVYTECLKEGQAVAIDKDKFDKLPFDKQVRMFREEISVIAAERWLLNPKTRGKVSWLDAYRYSLRKTVTALTKNWATEFIVLNMEHFVKPDISYFRNIFEKLPEGGNIMANVDLSVFEQLAEKLGVSIDTLVYQLCEDDQDDFNKPGLDYPDRKGRDWSDPSFQAERDAYFTEREKHIEEVLNEAGGYEHLEQEGGGEGGAEACYGVFRLGDKIYKGFYSYYSYEGDRYDDIAEGLVEVQPKVKTVTVYE